MLLQPHVRGGKVGIRELKARYQRLLKFHWKELIHLKNVTARKQSSYGDNRRKTALRLVQSGEISRAARVLTSQGLAPKSDVLQMLKLKHPVGSIDSSKVPSGLDMPDPICLDKSVFVNAIKRSPRGSGCGLSGWRYEHIQILLDNEITFDSLLSVCNTIASGDVPHTIIPLLSASKLIVLRKTGSDIRPIAIREVFCDLQLGPSVSRSPLSFLPSFFPPLQHGTATPEEGELLTHHIQILLEKNPDWSILKRTSEMLSTQYLESAFYNKLRISLRLYTLMSSNCMESPAP